MDQTHAPLLNQAKQTNGLLQLNGANQTNWCPVTLQAVANLYNITVDDLKRNLSMPQCEWIYSTNYKNHLKGERCCSRVREPDFVFCNNHHKTAKGTTGAVMLNRTVETSLYIESIGLISATIRIRTGGRDIILIQGNRERFDLNIPMIQAKLGNQVKVEIR